VVFDVIGRDVRDAAGRDEAHVIYVVAVKGHGIAIDRPRIRIDNACLGIKGDGLPPFDLFYIGQDPVRMEGHVATGPGCCRTHRRWPYYPARLLS
jgi:hypothetical protein